MENNTDCYKLFEIEHFLNKRIVKKYKSIAIEYLIR